MRLSDWLSDDSHIRHVLQGLVTTFGLKMVYIASMVFGHVSMVRGAQVQSGICSLFREMVAGYWQVIGEWRGYKESFNLSLSLFFLFTHTPRQLFLSICGLVSCELFSV